MSAPLKSLCLLAFLLAGPAFAAGKKVSTGDRCADRCISNTTVCVEVCTRHAGAKGAPYCKKGCAEGEKKCKDKCAAKSR